MKKLLSIDRREVYRYLGIKDIVWDDALKALVESAVDRVAKAADPRVTSSKVDITINDDAVTLCESTIVSRDLAQHLNGCRSAVVFAATLGSGVDRLLAKDSIVQPSLAIAEQAAAAAIIEQYCDDCCRELEQSLCVCGEHLLPRYSPGYGDCPMEAQKLLLTLLEAQKRIGLTLTDKLMMTPMKSVTALIGISRDRRQGSGCYQSGCSVCSNTRCLFRKNDELFQRGGRA